MALISIKAEKRRNGRRKIWREKRRRQLKAKEKNGGGIKPVQRRRNVWRNGDGSSAGEHGENINAIIWAKISGQPRNERRDWRQLKTK
jgi:hypothetical protein